ncbi:hypothetical protein WME90_01850 [Sorangium sp. So ce375]|uniref:hypothetical protein n=1 Tax=Sorangium sp. So ce375 TaxID=3133306 RepID=UPI003F5C70F8
MTSETEAACRDFVEKMEQAWAAAGLASKAIEGDRELGGREAAKRLDPELVGRIVLAHGLAKLLVDRVGFMAVATCIAGSQNGRGWQTAVADVYTERLKRLKNECSCSDCERCRAGEAAVQRANDVARAANS